MKLAARITRALEGVGIALESIRANKGRATLTIPESGHMMTGGRLGRHTEYLGHMLSEMQIVARSHPGAEW